MSEFYIGKAASNPSLSNDPHQAASLIRNVGAVVALAAVKPLGQGAYHVVALRTCSPAAAAETEAELRRELVRLAETETAKPDTTSFGIATAQDGQRARAGQVANDSDDWRARRAVRKAAEAAAAEAELERLDAVGATIRARAGGEIDYGRLALALDAGQVFGTLDTRQPISWIRRAFKQGADPGPLGVALARAIDLAGR